MKKTLLPLAFLISIQFSFSQTLRLITYNIRYDNAGDGINQWNNRKEKVAELLKKNDPDIFGIQEGLNNQVDDLKKLLPDYNCVGVGRDDGKTKGEYSAIFYKRSKFKVLKDSTFWLSETQNIPGSKSWDAAITRICTWAKFEEVQSGKEFFLFNTHFDHLGDTARINSASLIKKNAARLAGSLPVIIMGDFNCEPNELPYQILTDNSNSKMHDSYNTATKNAAENLCTFTGFEVNGKNCKRIDYIFTDAHWTVNIYNTMQDNEGGYYYSDHLPVMVEVSFHD